MSLTKWTTVHCDGEGCSQWDSDGGGGFGAKEARDRAHAKGWITVRGGTVPTDLCPRCAKRKSEGTP